MGDKLRAVDTPVTVEQVRAGLIAAWKKLYSEEPSKKTIAVLLAQSAHETGRWKAIKCFNLGGMKSKPWWNYDFTYFTTTEVLSPMAAHNDLIASSFDRPCELVERTKSGKVKVRYKPEHPTACFRAFRTLVAGCEAYLEFLRKQFGPAWTEVQKGDPKTFVLQLKRQGYFTAEYTEYLAAVESLFWQYLLGGTEEVKAFQREHGLKDDGVVGPLTRKALEDEEPPSAA